MTIGSLFAGIGGLELGLERAGLGPTLWQVEIDAFCRAVLAKHWPNATRYEDVTRPRNYPYVDLICGGFPCQDVSSLGKKRGLGGERSSLWWHFARVVEQVAPAWVVVENVASGAGRWLHHVRHTLHLLGYGTRALGIAAGQMGAPHLRRRIFVVAHAHGIAPGESARSPREQGRRAASPRAHGARRRASDSVRVEKDLEREGRSGLRGAWNGGRDGRSPVSPIRRVDDGLSRRLDPARKRALGNAVVPQCGELVGQIIQAMKARISQVQSVERKEK